MRNLSAKAAQLPSDVLLYIFQMAQGHELYQYSDSRESPFDNMGRFSCPYQWLRLTHVCHRWRSIALSSPSLWTTIHLTGKDGCWRIGVSKTHRHLLHPELLQRVGPNAPLSIYATHTEDTETSGFIECLPLLHRTRHLCLARFTDYPASTPSAPLLQTLAIRLQSRSGSWSYSATGSPLPCLFGGSAPSVRSLAVFGASRLSNTTFGNLRNLFLETYLKGDFDSLVSFLAANPKLEEIIFRSIEFGAFKGQAVTHIGGRAHLPKLVRLAFDKCSGAAAL